MKIKVLFVTAAAIALSAGMAPAPVMAQSGNPASMLLDSLENTPLTKGAEMANEIAGDEIIKTDDQKLNVKNEDQAAIHAPVREFSDTVDPVTAEAVRALDQAGVLRRQSAMAEGIILMKQQMEYAAQIEALLETLGPDAVIEVSPGVYQSFEDSPVAISARMNQLRLQKELAVLEAEVAESTGTRTVTDLSPAIDEVGQPKLRTRSDGSEFSVLPGSKQVGSKPAPREQVAPAAPGGSSEDLKKLEAQLKAAEARLAKQEARLMSFLASREVKNTPSPSPSGSLAKEWAGKMSVKEIYGGFGKLTAVVELEGVERRVRVGNLLPGGFEVLRITEQSVEIGREDDVAQIRF